MASNPRPPKEHQEPDNVWPLPPDGLRLALWLDGQGGGAPIDWYNVERWSRGDGTLWLQIDPRHEGAMAALRESELLAPDELQLLLNSPPRATLQPVGNRCLLMSVRGVGMAGEILGDPAGVARTWFDPNLVLALLEYDAEGTEDVYRLYREGRGPRDGPELLAWFAKMISDKFYVFATELEASMVDVEARQPLRSEALQRFQFDVLQLHRHLAPHKVMASRAVGLTSSPFIRQHIELWRDIWDQNDDTDQLLRTLQQRNLAVQHYASEQRGRSINAAALVLALVSTITLPLGLVGAVLSMDLAMPEDAYPWLQSTPAALSVPAVMVVLVALATWIARRHTPLRQRASNEGGRASQSRA